MGVVGIISLTVVFVPRSTTKVNAIHAPLEVIQRVGIRPIRPRSSSVAPGIPLATLSLFLEAFRGLPLFLADAMLLVFLPTHPPGGQVKKCAVGLRLESRTIPSTSCLLCYSDSKMT